MHHQLLLPGLSWMQGVHFNSCREELQSSGGPFDAVLGCNPVQEQPDESDRNPDVQGALVHPLHQTQ